MQPGVLRRVFIYLALFAVFLPAASLAANALYQRQRQQVPAPASTLDVKIPWYLEHKNDYPVIFIGDSRTLTDIHPLRLEPYLKAPSFNLGHWATWMPMQYVIFRDLIGQMPENTVVVWTVGHQNFAKQNIQATYPVGWKKIPGLMEFGYGLPELLKVQLFFTPATMLFAQSDKFFRKISSVMDTPLFRAGAPPAANFGTGDDAVLRKFRTTPGTGFTKPWHDGNGRVVSVEQYMTDGSYLRTEIDPAYYRSKQAEQKQGLLHGGFTADAASWKPFIAVLELCRRNHIRLIVNEVEEAPYRYASPAHKDMYRSFMRETVGKTVESYGFPYIRADFDALESADYFDYNHMNSAGVEKYTPLFGGVLRRAIKEHYPDAL